VEFEWLGDPRVGDGYFLRKNETRGMGGRVRVCIEKENLFGESMGRENYTVEVERPNRKATWSP
jgi:hypothetical protein